MKNDFTQLSKHVVGSLFFVSNAMYWMEAGYFDAASNTKWLLHTWSLSVEWQFYLLYPFIIVALIRGFGRKNLTKSIFVTLVASFILSILITRTHPSAAFYLIPTRAWEMIAGGIVFMVSPNLDSTKKKWIEIVGFLLVVISYVFISESVGWPGYAAFIPVAGACLILLANNQESSLTSNRVCQFLGANSYSIYLWHWPVVVYMSQNNITAIHYKAIGILGSLFLGWISCKYVENIARKTKGDQPKKSIKFIPYITFSATLIAALFVFKNDGLPLRFPGDINRLSEIQNVYAYFNIPGAWRNGECHSSPVGMSERERIEKCAEKGNQVFLWGDSYAAALYPGLLKLQKENPGSFAIDQFTDGNGAPFFKTDGKADNNKGLMQVNEEKLSIVSKLQPQKILMTWMVNGGQSITQIDQATKGIELTISKIKSASPKSEIIIIGPVPFWTNNLVAIMQKYWQEKGVYPPVYIEYGLDKSMFEWDDKLSETVKNLHDDNVKYISALSYLCNVDGCITRVGDGPKMLSAADWGHLTPAASEYFIGLISKDIMH